MDSLLNFVSSGTSLIQLVLLLENQRVNGIIDEEDAIVDNSCNTILSNIPIHILTRLFAGRIFLLQNHKPFLRSILLDLQGHMIHGS